MAPGPLQGLLPLKIVRVESLRDGVREADNGFSVSRWLEHVETDLTPEYALSDGRGVVFAEGPYRYLAAWPDAALLSVLVGRMAGEAGLKTIELPEGIRIRSSADHILAFNYSSAAIDIGPVETALGAVNRVSGSDLLEPAGVAIWER